MDPSKYHFSTEGCSSSESGWTMYIDSPMQEDDVECNNDDDDDNNDNNYRNSNNDSVDDEDNKEESDDSMASDASSGPSHQHKRANAHEGGHSMASTSKQGKGDKFRKIFSWNKAKEKEKKSGEKSTKYKPKK